MHTTAISGAEMGPQLLAELALYRYRVFVETLGWKLDCKAQRELDQFDHDDAHYLLLRDEWGELAGCARLLPTTRPYLLSEVFPMLVSGQPPADPTVWELSRFVAMRLADTGPRDGGAQASRQFLSDQTLMLLRTAIGYARQHGVRRLVTVSPISVERLLSIARFPASRLAPPQTVGGHRLFACQIDCTPALAAPRPAAVLPALVD